MKNKLYFFSFLILFYSLSISGFENNININSKIINTNSNFAQKKYQNQKNIIDNNFVNTNDHLNNFIELLSPNGFQQWEANSTKKILFKSNGINNIKIEYSSDNGTTWNIITNSTSVSGGEFSWKLPSTISDKYLIKLTGLEQNLIDQSDNNFSVINIKNPNNQDFIFFSDSPTSNFYDPSWGFATSPSSLELINQKAPVTYEYSLVGNYSIKMNWRSVPNGDWGLAIAGAGWIGRDILTKDTLIVNIFSKNDLSSLQLPMLFFEDINNKKTAKTSLANYISSIKANQWNKVIVPLKWFKDNPGSANLQNIKTIYFGQNKPDDIQNTFYLDDIRMIGGKPISGDARKLIVVLGSSTAAGTGASPIDSSWVRRFNEFMLSKDPNSYLVNLAVGGYTTYDVMPSYFVPPSNKPLPKTENNITKALTYKPWAILINLPSNDANMNYTVDEQIFNLKTIVKEATNNKIKVWITTTQPRNFSQSQRDNLKVVKDSIKSTFKNFAVDVFTPLANPDGTIKSIFNSGDGIHLNNAGHKIIYDKFIEAKVWETITGIEILEQELPKTFSLKQNYPNPFNPSTTIEFSLPVVSYVDIKVYDILGREIKTLTHKKYFPGIYKIDFNALNLASGMYIYRIIANDENNSSYIKTMKMILTK
ncbi:MAG: GDSL-type esterase/lipase family protein [Melioribacteraceae bacterium]|nr:GDSL-type esterase/lipase family protein [Melioribacteraceae bacterium]